MNAITRLLLNVIVPCLPVNHNTASDINAPNSDLNGNQGGFVIVPGPNGLMQSATVRQLLQGYYELEVGSSGETIWVPVNGVMPE